MGKVAHGGLAESQRAKCCGFCPGENVHTGGQSSKDREQQHLQREPAVGCRVDTRLRSPEAFGAGLGPSHREYGIHTDFSCHCFSSSASEPCPRSCSRPMTDQYSGALLALLGTALEGWSSCGGHVSQARLQCDGNMALLLLLPGALLLAAPSLRTDPRGLLNKHPALKTPSPSLRPRQPHLP